MQNTNPSGKSLSELIKDADSKGVHIVLVGCEDDVTKHAELIAKMGKKHEIEIVCIKDLSLSDQEKVNQLQTEKAERNKAFENPPIPIKNYHEHLPEISLKRDDMNKQWYEKFAKGKKRRKF